MKQKYEYHASKSRPARASRIAAACAEKASNVDTDGDDSSTGGVPVVGQDVLKGLGMPSLIRARTPEEKDLVGTLPKRTVREETAAALQSIVDYLESNPSQEYKYPSYQNCWKLARNASTYAI